MDFNQSLKNYDLDLSAYQI